MITFLLDTALYGSLWLVKTTYNGMHYLINGHIETSEEKLNKLIEENIEYQKEIKELLNELKKDNNN